MYASQAIFETPGCIAEPWERIRRSDFIGDWYRHAVFEKIFKIL
jgi:hypothetical protein